MQIRQPLLIVSMIIGGILLPLNGFGIEAETVLNALQKKYAESKQLEYKGQYQLFKGHKGEDLHESYSTYFYSDNGQCYQKMGSAVTVFASSFTLQMEHEERSIGLYKAQKAPGALTDVKTLLQQCKKSNCMDKGDAYEVVLEFNSNVFTPYSSMIFLISKKDYHLLQMDIYYAAARDFSENSDNPDMHLPHVRMTFSDISFNAKKKDHYFQLESYLLAQENTFIVQSEYSGYSLTDHRLKQ